MDKKHLLELKKLYQRYKAGYTLTCSEKELLQRFINLSHSDKIEFSQCVNESVEDIETFIEKDIKRQ